MSTESGAVAAAEPASFVVVDPNGHRKKVPVDPIPFLIGRQPENHLILRDSRVSRSHARIVWHGGTFQLTDLSYNGTYVRFDHDPEVISLRRGSCTLHGSGMIGLGTPPTDALSPSVRFEVLRSGDRLAAGIEDRRKP